MPLHSKIEEFLRQIDKVAKPFEQMSIEDMREATRNFSRFQGRHEPVHQVFNRHIPLESHDLVMRVYQPKSQTPLPMILYFHSGGFVKGDVSCAEAFCRRLCNGTHAIVVSVNYRLAPEHPFPAAVHDAYDALCWIYKHAHEIGGDPHRIAVVGESSGGNLAAVTSIMTHKKKGPHVLCQVLIYPQLDYTFTFPSHELFKTGYFLSNKALLFYKEHYLQESADLKNPYISPYWNQDNRNLPSTYIITAEYDPLRDEAEAYADKLKQAGVKVFLHRYPGMVHGFVSMATLVEEAQDALQSICKAIQLAFKKENHKKSA